MIKFIRRLYHILQKSMFDIASTCYEDQDFKVMSLPRLAYFTSIVMFLVCTLAEVFGGYKVQHYDILVGFVTAAGATYVGKKYIDRGRPSGPGGGPDNG